MSSSAGPSSAAMIDGYSQKPPATENNEVGGSEILAEDASESSDNVWNKPVNGEVAPTVAENRIVIGGADLWPSLSEGVNTRVKPSYRTVPESSKSLPSHATSSKNNVVHSRGRTSSTHNGTRSAKQKSNATRSSVGNGERAHHHHQQRQSSQGVVNDVSSNNSFRTGNSQLEAGQNNGPRLHFHSGGNHSQHRDSNRRGNGGPPHGDGSHARHHDLDRDASGHSPSYNGSNGPVQPPVFPDPLPAPIPWTALPLSPYHLPLFLPMPFMAPGMPLVAGRPVLYGPQVGQIAMRPHPLYIPGGPPSVITELLKQIDYYFSDENLVKDVHLRRNMDEQGWVMVTTIAKFQKVNDIIAKVKQFLEEKKIDPLQFISNAMLNSYNVEVQGDKLRKRIDWKKYILRNSGEFSLTAAASQANVELAARFENTVIEKEPVNSDSKLVAEDKAMDDHAEQQPS